MRGPSARVVLNRQALTELGLAVADGAGAIVQAVVVEADPPDATPFGEGLVTSGGWLVYNRGRKVGGGSLLGRQPRKPRGWRVRQNEGIEAIAGFGFPGRFQELGTIHHAAQPFLWPAFLRVQPRIPDLMRPAIRALRGGGARFRAEPESDS